MQSGWRFSGIGEQKKRFRYGEVLTQPLVLSESMYDGRKWAPRPHLGYFAASDRLP